MANSSAFRRTVRRHTIYKSPDALYTAILLHAGRPPAPPKKNRFLPNSTNKPENTIDEWLEYSLQCRDWERAVDKAIAIAAPRHPDTTQIRTRFDTWIGYEDRHMTTGRFPCPLRGPTFSRHSLPHFSCLASGHRRGRKLGET